MGATEADTLFARCNFASPGPQAKLILPVRPCRDPKKAKKRRAAQPTVAAV
jgi:hypothetical protein